MPTIDGSIPSEMLWFLITASKAPDCKVDFSFPKRMAVARARNELVREAITEWYDYLLFCDDDNPPENNHALERLLQCNEDIVTWLVRWRQHPYDLCVFEKYEKDWVFEHIPIVKFPSAQEWALVEIDGCGTWFVLIKTNVLKEMRQHYNTCPFENWQVMYVKDEDWTHHEFDIHYVKRWVVPQGYFVKSISEDLLFFERCQRAGYKLWCDTWTKCKHIGIPKFVEVGDVFTKTNTPWSE